MLGTVIAGALCVIHDQTPDEDAYLSVVLLTLNKEGQPELSKALTNATCSIEASGTFSHVRWNGMATSVIFRLPVSEYSSLVLGDDEKLILRAICNKVMPSEAGLDIMHVDIAPSLDFGANNKSLQEDLATISASLESVAANFTLPVDILDKGKEMSQAYLYLYAVENYLRLFVEKVASQHYGTDYFAQLNVPNNVKTGISKRKELEAKNTWISVRGGSDLFYLDFKDISDLILNNWDLFKSYFPDQSWISSKINELGNCRNLVAHNSFLGDHEKDVIRVYFNSIVKQLNPHMALS